MNKNAETNKSPIHRIIPIIKTENISYNPCSMHINIDKKEFYYHFKYLKDTKKKFFNFNTQKETGRPDHITWHEDGHGHLRLKNNSGKLLRERFPDNTFIPNKNIITPLLIHSVYKVNDTYNLPQIDLGKITSNEENKYYKSNTLPKKSSFSIIVFLTPRNISVGQVLNELWFNFGNSKATAQQVQLASHAGRINVWDGWAIDYFLTDLTLPISNSPIIPYYSAFCFVDLHLALKDFFLLRMQQFALRKNEGIEFNQCLIK